MDVEDFDALGAGDGCRRDAAHPALALPADLAPTDSAHERRYSNRSLKGRYATVIEGFFLDAPSPVAFRGIAITHFDGKGSIRQVDHIVFGGATPPVDWAPSTGTYTVNPDCTGQSEHVIPGSPISPLRIRFVVGDNGNVSYAIPSMPGYAITSTSTRVHQPK